MHSITPILLFIVGLIHLLPLSGLLGADHLARLYGIMLDDPNLVILMRHRALSIALLGMLLLAAARERRLRVLACCAGLASTLSFMALGWNTPAVNPLIARVVVADALASVCLLVALALHLFGEPVSSTPRSRRGRRWSRRIRRNCRWTRS